MDEALIAILDSVHCETGRRTGALTRQLRSASQPHSTQHYLVCISPTAVLYVEADRGDGR